MKFVTLVFNAKNPVGLGTNTKGTAEEVWELFKAGYEVTSNMASKESKLSDNEITVVH